MPVPIEGLDEWRHLALDAIGSTNTEALRLGQDGDPGKLWVTANQQLAGKARRGRGWVSEPGNLYSSLLLVDPAPADSLVTLPLVASLALHKAVCATVSGIEAKLKIKWPNDLLLNGKKVSGILLEATQVASGQSAVVIGLGVNCQHYPDNPLYPATSLVEQGALVFPHELFVQLAIHMAAELTIWQQPNGFATIRKQWLERAIGVGEIITARFSDHEITGRFVDIDSDGFLLMEGDTGHIQKVSAADIFFGTLDANRA